MLSEPLATAIHIAGWMREKLWSIGRNSFVVGVSGGIDSAVSFRLAQMTGERVCPVFLPRNTAQEDELHPLVEELCGGTDLEISYIESLIDAEALPHIPGGNRRALAIGNLHARARMASLYYYAEYHNGIVVGTTNLAEWFEGYYTKYGDGGVDIEPLCGLLKHEVYQLGREGFPVPVPASILEAVPSANLWAGQTDEGELGFTYDDLDRFIGGDTESVDADVRAMILRRHQATEHKRRQPEHCCVPGRECIICEVDLGDAHRQ